jgi:hypothetical protein
MDAIVVLDLLQEDLDDCAGIVRASSESHWLSGAAVQGRPRLPGWATGIVPSEATAAVTSAMVRMRLLPDGSAASCGARYPGE